MEEHKTVTTKEQAYKALYKAAEQIGENNYRKQITEYKKHHKSTKKFRFTVTEAHNKLIKAMGDVLNDRITVEEAMSLLFDPEVFYERFN